MRFGFVETIETILSGKMFLKVKTSTEEVKTNSFARLLYSHSNPETVIVNAKPNENIEITLNCQKDEYYQANSDTVKFLVPDFKDNEEMKICLPMKKGGCVVAKVTC